MSKCDQCGAVLGSKFIGPPVPIVMAHRRFDLCIGCAVSIAEALCLQVRTNHIARPPVVQRIDPDLRYLMRGTEK